MRVYKDKYDGWVANDTIDIGNDRRLSINTKKDGRRITTFATVSTVKDGISTFIIFKDFYKVYQSHPAWRVTQKVVTDIHNFVNIDNIKADAIAFYNK